MNSSAYVFGNLGGNYTQYPEDYAHEIYEEFLTKADAPSQVIIHRDKSIMYYGYVRKLDREGQFIGLCVLLNGVMLSKVSPLFTVFEKVVSEMVSQGELIKMDDKGDIVGTVEHLEEKHQEVERIVTYLREEVIHWESTATLLPPISYGVSNDSCQTFSSSDRDENVVAASVKYGYTCVQKNEGYDTPLLAGLRNVLREKSGVKDSPQKATIDSGTQKKNTKTQQNFWWIATIIVFVVVCISVVINSIKKTPPNEATGTTLSEVQSNSKLEDVSTEATKKVAQEDVIKKRLKDFWTWAWKGEKNWKELPDYCSTDFMNLMAKVELASDINGYDFDGYHTMLDDPMEMEKLNIDIHSLSFENERKVRVSGKLFDSSGQTNLSFNFSSILVYEKNNWYIDDYTIKDYGEDKSERTSMKEYAQYFCVDTSPNKSPNKKEAYQKYLKRILNECEWYRHRDGGFLFPSRTGDVYEEKSAELAGSYLSCFNEWGAVHLNYFVVFGGVVEMPYVGSGLGAEQKVKSITYKNGAGDVFSGLTNDGSVYYLKKHVSIIEDVPCPSAHVLVLIYPRECQDVITPMIDAVNKW